jgi:hypothetical protein
MATAAKGPILLPELAKRLSCGDQSTDPVHSTSPESVIRRSTEINARH